MDDLEHLRKNGQHTEDQGRMGINKNGHSSPTPQSQEGSTLRRAEGVATRLNSMFDTEANLQKKVNEHTPKTEITSALRRAWFSDKERSTEKNKKKVTRLTTRMLKI